MDTGFLLYYHVVNAWLSLRFNNLLLPFSSFDLSNSHCPGLVHVGDGYVSGSLFQKKPTYSGSEEMCGYPMVLIEEMSSVV